MNAIERRISEGLQAYAEGLDVTTQDIDRLERELDLRQPTPSGQRRGKFWQGAVAACAVTGLALGALALRDDMGDKAQPAGPPPVDMRQLEGIWRVTDSDWLWRFGADGRVTISNVPTCSPASGGPRPSMSVPRRGASSRRTTRVILRGVTSSGRQPFRRRGACAPTKRARVLPVPVASTLLRSGI